MRQVHSVQTIQIIKAEKVQYTTNPNNQCGSIKRIANPIILIIAIKYVNNVAPISKQTEKRMV